MLNNVILTARNRRRVILPRNVEKEEEFLNVALGNVSFSQHGQLSTMYILCSRRDKVFCHDCRFCCTLSLCTNQHGTYFRESSDKNLTGSKNKEIYPGFSLVEAQRFMVLLRQLSYAIKNQLKAPKGTLSLVLYGIRAPIVDPFSAWKPPLCHKEPAKGKKYPQAGVATL